MQGKYKKFDSETFEQTDARARQAVLQEIQEMGLYITENDDKYGPDLVVYSGFRKSSYIEVEMKLAWSTSSVEMESDPKLGFPFDTIQIPERKGKFLRLRHPVEFWLLNGDCTAAIIIPDSVLDKEMLVEVPNRLVSGGELFFSVPIDRCIFRRIGNEPQSETI